MLIYKMQDPSGVRGPLTCAWGQRGWSLSGWSWRCLTLVPCYWGIYCPPKELNDPICVKERQVLGSSCASTEDGTSLMNPRLETSSVRVWGHESPGRGEDFKVPWEIGGKGRTEQRDETTHRSHCIVLNPVSKF